MRTVLFCHSLLSDWNHGNAHFLRGVVTELQARGHDVRVYEPRDAWSVLNLVADAGAAALDEVRTVYPSLECRRYDEATLDLDEALDGADLVLVHEWNTPALVQRIGRHRARGGRYALLFHDTHHRSVSAPQEMARYDLDAYDGVLAFGEVIRERYVANGWSRRAWTWHEAADARVFRPRADRSGTEPGAYDHHLVWIGNWGDDERSQELRDFLIEPVRQLGLRARIHGVRYPDAAKAELAAAGIEYAGWLPNYRAPAVFARAAVTVHVPRRPYVEALPGIPTIRVFEALACGIPLVSCWWDDREGLFTRGRDYLSVRARADMTAALRAVLNDGGLAASLARHGRETILNRHTCAHRVEELLTIVESGLGRSARREAGAAPGLAPAKAFTI
ncbi:MAG TPA: glycosyltransferase [Vicinamibacterales bacterium]|nr:glycosyltransferase [Vicinamibacterales bacterium]